MAENSRQENSPTGYFSGQYESRDVRDFIGQNLRDVYQEVVEQPLPEKFVDLLRRLEEKGDDE